MIVDEDVSLVFWFKMVIVEEEEDMEVDGVLLIILGI